MMIILSASREHKSQGIHVASKELIICVRGLRFHFFVKNLCNTCVLVCYLFNTVVDDRQFVYKP